MGRQEGISRYERSAEEKPRGGWVSPSSAERTERRGGGGGWYRCDPSRTVQSNPTFISPFVDRSLLRAVDEKEGRKVYRYSEFQVAKKKKSAGILGSYALRFSSHASALVQRIDSRNKYEYCIYEEKGLFARAVQNLIGWSKMERDRHRTSETSRLIIRRVVQDHNWTNRAKEEMNEINRSIVKFVDPSSLIIQKRIDHWHFPKWKHTISHDSVSPTEIQRKTINGEDRVFALSSIL